MRFGVQVSVAGGPRAIVARAAERGCEALQLWSSNPRAWRLVDADDEALGAALRAAGLGPVLLHAPYLVNIASHDARIWGRSVAALVHACERAARLGACVVVHAGRALHEPRDAAVERAATALRAARQLVPRARVLVEPTAGGRGSVASTVDELAGLLGAAGDDVGVCLDTCHVHAAGHDLSSRASAHAFLDAFDAGIGLERVAAIHANDARDPAGSARDRHWHVGLGTIGANGFRAVLRDPRLSGVTVVLETPGDAADDRANLDRARGFSRPARASARGRTSTRAPRGRSRLSWSRAAR